MKNLDRPVSKTGLTAQEEQGAGNKFYQGVTKREQACIALLIPESGDEELDDLIRKSRRQKLAGGIAAGLMASTEIARKPVPSEFIGRQAISTADELIKQLESE